jgi:single-strand DNA-binding protein
MAGVNKCILIGNLGKDPESKNLESGNTVTTFSLATSESYKDKQGNKVDQTEWHNIVLWGKLAEIASKYLKKGSSIYLEGKIRTRSWDDKDGNKKYTTEIIGESFTMLGKKEGEKTDDLPF